MENKKMGVWPRPDIVEVIIIKAGEALKGNTENCHNKYSNETTWILVLKKQTLYNLGQWFLARSTSHSD